MHLLLGRTSLRGPPPRRAGPKFLKVCPENMQMPMRRREMQNSRPVRIAIIRAIGFTVKPEKAEEEERSVKKRALIRKTINTNIAD